MQRRLLLSSPLLEITISRLCQQLIENHQLFADSVILGLQPRGIHLAQRIHQELQQTTGSTIPFGWLDATFHRDDFRRRESIVRANQTKIPFTVEGKRVILVDDVIATGRMVRAALDAMTFFGRPEKVELAVLIDRSYNRDIPIAPDYVGLKVNTLDTQRVIVEWKEQGHEKDGIWLSD
ncbi:bifunctional pyr operon transcriptional regulator/uracil phosphoribosyltransferase [Siphonobacter sp. BAB-5385]|uniref:Bifunctional pyr operon transcriptional regulator/uracil phosphoribosyltransferase PyrR n=1 Tax=Siphonobacter curvatus TaxID=2094562 RepID=A0A2S7IPI8_9BACT|nr:MULTISPECIES: bifunctional pyr operon transcriptional regulator/uracil phosphoribosyltransferase PyrR [Siphonobacter]OZI06380.1 bifunctional pyr operon transcriptional regulator/uracil phosphoribosyltransferase [Siphonobacter sp. BAB-5385]PMD99225.1 bifunctional pyr operon transcriptional regulator/uracil phosphoribosyltransferase [Siphonobacter sp. BAB-5405]PQA59634.1 bifunctional pyr operon transcriptional regulator/uracil phosphoribosyltransferase PyrR [Siphonobacter curvatus]